MHFSRVAPDGERGLERLVGALHWLGAHDSRDAQVQLVEVFDRDGFAHGVLLRGVLLVLGMRLRRPRHRHLSGWLEQCVDLFFVDARDKVSVIMNLVTVRQRSAGIFPS